MQVVNQYSCGDAADIIHPILEHSFRPFYSAHSFVNYHPALRDVNPSTPLFLKLNGQDKLKL